MEVATRVATPREPGRVPECVGLLGASAMAFARYFPGRAFVGMACVAFLGLIAQGVFAEAPRAATGPPAAQTKPAATNSKTPIPTNAKPTAIAPTTPVAAAPATHVPAADARLSFSFRYQPWQQVLDWFAEQAGLSLLMDSPPPGTFNYTDSRELHHPRSARRAQRGPLDQGFHARAARADARRGEPRRRHPAQPGP